MSKPGVGKHKGIDWSSQPLGDTYDTTIARELGVSQTTVSQARRRRGIPRHQPVSESMAGVVVYLPRWYIEKLVREAELCVCKSLSEHIRNKLLRDEPWQLPKAVKTGTERSG